jgi:carboxypeptidase Q
MRLTLTAWRAVPALALVLLAASPVSAPAQVAGATVEGVDLEAAATAAPAALPAPATVGPATERLELDVIELIRDEGLNRSRIPELAGHLTDVVGPRLTNSPGMRRAYDWTSSTLRGWGLENVVVEPWGEFGRGWENVAISFRALTPYETQLHAVPVAWSGGTDGVIRGPAVAIDVETPADVERYRGQLAGAFVLIQPYREIEPEWEPQDRRYSEEWLLEPQPAGPARVSREEAAERLATAERFQRQREIRAALSELMREERVAAVLQPSGWTYGLMRVGGTGAWRTDTPIGPPELVVAHESYGQVWRNLQRGIPVELELYVENRWYDDDLQAHNVLADLPGTDRAHELVMIGAHLDSWHAGTGATDNAAGSVVMMEAMRILKTLGLAPRRTIRIALWSAEEQGLWGSRMYVENHPELHDRISAYLNFDNGTGRIRGIYSQMNDDVVPVFEQLMAPFQDLGAVAVRHANTGGTDHLAFDRAGIPGFQFVQDPIEYGIRSHHSHVDTFERLVLDDLKQAAVIVASLAYHIANRDRMLPRKGD